MANAVLKAYKEEIKRLRAIMAYWWERATRDNKADFRAKMRWYPSAIDHYLSGTAKKIEGYEKILKVMEKINPVLYVESETKS